MSTINRVDCTDFQNSHTQSYSVTHVRGSITWHIDQYPAVFGEKQEVLLDQLPLRQFPSVYLSPGGRHSAFVFIFHFSVFVFNFLIFTSPFWKNGKVKNKNEMCPPWASVVYITCLKIFFIASCYFVQSHRYC